MHGDNELVKKRPWDRITAITAAVTALISVMISLAALFITSENSKDQLELAWTHNKLSVRPILSFKRVLSSANERIGVAIENEGLGPALIKRMIYGLNNEWLDETGRKGAQRVLRELDIPRRIIAGGSYADNGRSILSQGETKWLYYAVTSEDFEEKRELLKKISTKVNLAICYCSMYGECSSLILREPHPPTERFTCDQ